MDDIDSARRAVMMGGGIGVLALAGLGGSGAQAAKTTKAPGEAANAKLVKDLCATWSAPDFDADKMMAPFFADDAQVRVIDSQPFVTGPAAICAAFKPFVAKGERYRVEFLDVTARGPLVITHRIDSQIGSSAKGWEIIGIFDLKDGKIREWTDYLIGEAA